MKKSLSNQLIRSAGAREKSIAESFTQMVTGVYVFAMMVIFPLFFQNKFYDMGGAKYNFFKYVNIVVLPCVVLLSLICLVLAVRSMSFQELLGHISVTDWFVIAYLLVVLISYASSPYREHAWWGAGGWNMGLFSQLVFVGIYFAVSRFFEIKRTFIYGICAISGIVFLLGILNRFGIDPLNMYDNGTVTDRSYLSTLGQPTWYSSFLCTVFPIGLFMFWNSEHRKEDVIFGIYLLLSFATLVTQNSDSAYIGLAFIMLGLFCFSCSSNRRLIRFTAVCAIALTAFKFMGLLQILFPHSAFKNDTLSRVAAQSSATLVLWLVVLAVLAALIYLDKKNKLNAAKLKKLPMIVCIALAVLFLFAVVLIACVTTGNVPDSLAFLKDSNYLNFNDTWGNSRGINWKYAVKLIGDSSLWQRIFGCGPDCYEWFLYDRYQMVMDMFWGVGSRLSNAHNEWLNTLVTLGLAGFTAYAGIFISKIVTCAKRAAREPVLIGVLLCILGYMGHNLFCYQQIICTPLIFIIMGAGEYVIRETKAAQL